MKTKLHVLILAIALVMPSVSTAASQDECAIWLCLPLGFAPSDCEKPRKAMIKRLSEFKGAVPAFSSCSVDGNSNGMELSGTVASFYPHTLSLDFNDVCLPFVNDKPGCIPYTVLGVTQYGEKLGEEYFRPLNLEEPSPAFTPTQLAELQCEHLTSDKRLPLLTDEYCADLLDN